MAPMLFAKAILTVCPIKVFNHGRMERYFTYIDDIVEGVTRCCDKPATTNKDYEPNNPGPASSACPQKIFNIGNNQPTNLMHSLKCYKTI